MTRFMKKHWRKIVLVIISIPVVGFFVICVAIGFGVRGAVADARESFPGEPVDVLIAVATSDEARLKDRNRAIWALGQLGSAEALPVLQSLQAGEKCDHDAAICQYELDKAIEGCSGGANLGAWVWRHGELAVSDRN